MTGAPYSQDEHDLDLPSDGVQEDAPAAALALDLEQFAPTEDQWIDPTVGVKTGGSRVGGPELCF